MNQMSTNIITGLIVSYSDDLGPRSIINLSSLTDSVADELASIGISTIFLGYSNAKNMSKNHNKILGPLPVPIDNQILLKNDVENDLEDTIVFTFNVKSDLPTDDPRIIKFGREVAIWFIYNSLDRFKVFESVKIIEELANLFLNKIKYESELFNETFFVDFLKEIQTRTSQIKSKEFNSNNAPKEIEIPNYSLYKFNFDSEKFSPIHNIEELKHLDIIIYVDISKKQISIIPLKPIPEKKLFMVSKSVSDLNLAFKRKFSIKIVNDHSEIMMVLRTIHKRSFPIDV